MSEHSSGNNIIILGGNGQLGTALRKLYPDAVAGDSDMLDITDSAAVAAFDWSPYDVVINAAAYTNVDGAETAEGRRVAWSVNAVAPALLASTLNQLGKTFVHVSTDYVFDGSYSGEHPEYEAFSPLGVYGASKAAGDIAVAGHERHYIVRTSWVIGTGKNFVRTMVSLGQKGVNPSVVSDQVGRLTFTADLAAGIKHLIESSAAFGTYNLSNTGEPASWADVTRAIFAIGGYACTVTDISTAEYFANKPDASPRPLNSSLDLSKITASGFTPRDWRATLKEYISEELKTEQESAA